MINYDSPVKSQCIEISSGKKIVVPVGDNCEADMLEGVSSESYRVCISDAISEHKENVSRFNVEFNYGGNGLYVTTSGTSSLLDVNGSPFLLGTSKLG